MTIQLKSGKGPKDPQKVGDLQKSQGVLTWKKMKKRLRS